MAPAFGHAEVGALYLHVLTLLGVTRSSLQMISTSCLTTVDPRAGRTSTFLGDGGTFQPRNELEHVARLLCGASIRWSWHLTYQFYCGKYQDDKAHAWENQKSYLGPIWVWIWQPD